MNETFWRERLEELARHEDGDPFDVRDDVERGRARMLRSAGGRRRQRRCWSAAVVLGGPGWPGRGRVGPGRSPASRRRRDRARRRRSTSPR